MGHPGDDAAAGAVTQDSGRAARAAAEAAEKVVAVFIGVPLVC